MTNHIAKNCRAKINKYKVHKKDNENSVFSLDIINNTELLRYVGFMNDKPVDVVFDSGAIASVISKSTADKLKLKILPSDVQINTAEGEAHSVVGITEKLNIEIDEI